MKPLFNIENTVIACGQQYGIPAPSYVKFENGIPMRPDNLTAEQTSEYSQRVAVYIQHEQRAYASQTKLKIDSIQFWVKFFSVIEIIACVIAGLVIGFGILL